MIHVKKRKDILDKNWKNITGIPARKCKIEYLKKETEMQEEINKNGMKNIWPHIVKYWLDKTMIMACGVKKFILI